MENMGIQITFKHSVLHGALHPSPQEKGPVLNRPFLYLQFYWTINILLWHFARRILFALATKDAKQRQQTLEYVKDVHIQS